MGGQNFSPLPDSDSFRLVLTQAVGSVVRGGGVCAVPAERLRACGLEGEAYADWLTRHGWRQVGGGAVVRIMRARV